MSDPKSAHPNIVLAGGLFYSSESTHIKTPFLSVLIPLVARIFSVLLKYTSTTLNCGWIHAPFTEGKMLYRTVCLLRGTSCSELNFEPLNANSALASMVKLNVRTCIEGFSSV